MARKKAITLKEHARRIAPLGGKASMDARTPEERQEFARKGGQAGGKARAESLSKKKRQEIAKKAAAARWKDKPAKKAGQKPTAKSD
jgi:hypothetical protein